MGDGLECAAIASVFGCDENSQAQRPIPVAVSSTKGAVGHLLGAAGAVEAIFTVLAVKEQRCPPTVNLTRQSVDKSLLEHAGSLFLLMAEAGSEAGADGVEKKQQVDNEAMGVQMRVRAAMTNSFGFGGTNATLVFTKALR
jgi:3-oxoacyl-[acyl-carrier-protein] synthase II